MVCAPMEMPVTIASQPCSRDAESTLRRWSTMRRRHGTAAVLLRLGYGVLRRCLKLDVSHLLHLDDAAAASAHDADPNLVFRFLASDEIVRFAADPSNDLDATMATRLAEGHFCFAVLDGTRLANYAWYAVQSVDECDAKGVQLQLSPATAYLYKAYTHSDYRGRKMHGVAVERAREALHEHGIRRLLCLIEFANWPSLASHHRIGFRRMGSVVSIGGKFRFQHAARGRG